MDKLQGLHLTQAEPGTPTLLDSIIRAELKRRNVTQPVLSPSRPLAGASPPGEAAKRTIGR